LCGCSDCGSQVENNRPSQKNEKQYKKITQSQTAPARTLSALDYKEEIKQTNRNKSRPQHSTHIHTNAHTHTQT
jgi:hypothetical protein